MKYLFIEYPTCSTCKKAKKYLDTLGVEYSTRHIVEDTPNYEELKEWIQRSNLDIRKFFNTSGNVYKSENLKDKLLLMSEDEMLRLLASNGMLIKRPLLVGDDVVLAGFKSDAYDTLK